MVKVSFLQKHPLQHFTEEEKNENYGERESYYIRCLKAMEDLLDIDAYIIDYSREKIIYMTKNCSFRKFFIHWTDNKELSIDFFNKICPEEDLRKVAKINNASFDFFFDLPINRRYYGAYMLDVKIRNIEGGYTLVNYKVSVLDMTDDGRLRLGLCLLSYPTSQTTGKSYFKMTDTNTIYEYIENAGKFIEVKSQRLTPKSQKVLELASQGKTESEIAHLLGISLNTVKYHKQRIFKQLEVRNTAEAVQRMNSQKKMIDYSTKHIDPKI